MSCECDRATIRIRPTNPATNAFEDQAGRGRDFEQHPCRRGNQIDFSCGKPFFDCARGSFRAIFDSRLLIDDVDRFERSVGDGICHLRSHARNSIQGPRQSIVVSHIDAALGQRRNPTQDAQNQRKSELLIDLTGQNPQQRATEPVCRLERIDTIMRQSGPDEIEEIFIDSRSLGFDAPKIHPQARAIGWARLP